MFEDQSPDGSANPSIADRQNKNQNKVEPEDIFENTEASAFVQPAPPQAPISSAVGQTEQLPKLAIESALTSGKVKPAPAQVGGVPESQVSGVNEASFPFKQLIIIISITIGIFLIAFASFFIWKSNTNIPTKESEQVQSKDTQSSDIENSVESDSSAKNNAPIEEESAGILENFNQRQQDKALNPISEDLASKDTDQDGLSDAKEFDLGTNYRLVDSDSDGLSDWEEISIFGTDPLKKDTDNDSYLDGEEVQNGYNPLGEGKLLDFEKAQ